MRQEAHRPGRHRGVALEIEAGGRVEEPVDGTGPEVPEAVDRRFPERERLGRLGAHGGPFSAAVGAPVCPRPQKFPPRTLLLNSSANENQPMEGTLLVSVA